MKPQKILLVGGIAAGVMYYFAREKNTVDQLTYFVVGIKYNKQNSNLMRTELLLTLRISNPTSNPVSFDGFSGVLKITGSTLASTSTNKLFDGITLKPGNNDVTMPVIINHLSAGLAVASILKKLFEGTTQNIAIDITGSLQAAGIQIPLSQTVNLQLGKGAEGIGKARVSMEFATNEEAANYFQKSHIYVTPKPARGGNRFPGNPSLNGVGNCCNVGSVGTFNRDGKKLLYSVEKNNNGKFYVTLNGKRIGRTNFSLKWEAIKELELLVDHFGIDRIIEKVYASVGGLVKGYRQHLMPTPFLVKANRVKQFTKKANPFLRTSVPPTQKYMNI